MEEEKAKVISILRSVLQSSKEGILIHNLQRDYKLLVGNTIPFRELGYRSLEHMLESLPDVVRLARDRAGQILVMAVADESTQHIASLVSRQKSNKGKPFKNSVPPPRRRPFNYKMTNTNRAHFKPQPPQSYPWAASSQQRPQSVYNRVPQQQQQRSVSGEGSSLKISVNNSEEKTNIIIPIKSSSNFTPSFNKPSEPPKQNEQQSASIQHGNLWREPNLKFDSQAPQPPPVHPIRPSNGSKPSSTFQERAGNAISSWILEVPKTNPKKPNHAVSPPIAPAVVAPAVKPIVHTPKPPPASAPEPPVNNIPITNRAPASEINSVESSVLIDRIAQVISDLNTTTGLWNFKVEQLYLEAFNTTLPENWLTVIAEDPRFLIDSVEGKRAIVFFRKMANGIKATPSVPKPVLTPEPEPLPEYIPEAVPEAAKDGPMQAYVPDPMSEAYSLEIPNIEIPKGDHWDVAIVYVPEGNRVALNLLQYSEDIEILANQMNEFYDCDLEELKVIEVDPKALYTIKVDDYWIRVQVTQTLDEGVECYCVDFGDMETVSLDRLRILLPEFYNLPLQAFWVFLDNLEEYANNTTAIKILSERTIGKTFVGHVVLKNGDYYATIYDTNTEQDVNINELIPQLTLKESLTPIFPDGGMVREVSLRHLTTEGTLYFSLCGDVLNTFDNFMLEINQVAGALVGKVKEVQLNSTLYCAKFYDDGQFYRAQAIQKVEKLVEVLFVDFGNTSWVNVCDMVEAEDLDPMFEIYPFQALTCKLSGFPPEDYAITEETVTHFFDMTQQDNPILMKVITTSSESDCGIVELFMRVPSTKALVSINQSFALQPEEFFKPL